MLIEQSFFDSISDEIRRRILALLLKQGELCVCELHYALDMPQPKISRHLAVLREADVLLMRRNGTWIYYRIHAQLPFWAYKLLESMSHGVADTPAYVEDVRRLELMPNRPARCCA